MTSNTTDIAPHYETVLSSGKHWSLHLRRGLSLQLTDMRGNANVGMVFFNPHNLLERYNAPDTMKCQHTFHLTQAHCLYSDMGRVMASITRDSAGGHETICGNSYAEGVSEVFGGRSYQNDRNNWYQNGSDAFAVELSKYGLGKADLPSNINWFNRCDIAEDGQISLHEDTTQPGRTVHLRMEMDCLVILHTCPHAMCKAGKYPEMQIAVALSDAPPIEPDDECWNSCEENLRGFENNRLYHLGMA